MKSRVVPMIVMAAVLAGPSFAQVSSSSGTQVGGTFQPAPAHDPEVEVAFWDTVKDSGDPMLYLAYLEQFPGGAFRVIARNRLAELWEKANRAFAVLDQMGVSLDDVPPVAAPAPGPVVVSPPVVVTPKPAPAAPTWQRIRNTQSQLSKHGCYKGAIDGVWGDGSRAAMRRFNRRAGTSYPVQLPTAEAVNFMRELTKSGVQICR